MTSIDTANAEMRTINIQLDAISIKLLFAVDHVVVSQPIRKDWLQHYYKILLDSRTNAALIESSTIAKTS